MRSIIASLITFFFLAAVVLIASLFASIGVAAIGWVLSRLFDLSQWQGAILALGVTLGAGFLVYQLGGPPAPVVRESDWEDWEDSAPGESKGTRPAETGGESGRSRR